MPSSIIIAVFFAVFVMACISGGCSPPAVDSTNDPSSTINSSSDKMLSGVPSLNSHWERMSKQNMARRDQRQQLEQRFDRNNDGDVDRDQLAVFQETRYRQRLLEQRKIHQHLIDQWDKDGDGQLTRRELSEVYQAYRDLPTCASERSQALQTLGLRYLDHEGKGWLSPVEEAVGHMLMLDSRRISRNPNDPALITVNWSRR